MIKRFINIICISILSLLFLFIVVSRLMTHQYEYFIGKDTHRAFGNGEYQIMTQKDWNGVKTYSLYNMKYNETIIKIIQNYKKKANYVYFYGIGTSEIFVVLNTDNNKITYYSSNGADHLIYYNEMMQNDEIKVIYSFEKFKDEEKNMLKKLMRESRFIE